MKHILLNNLGSKCSLVMKFGQFMQHYKIIFFIKKLYEKCGLETSSRPFLIFKESSVKSLLQKFRLLIEVMLHSLQTQKAMELVLRSQFL